MSESALLLNVDELLIRSNILNLVCHLLMLTRFLFRKQTLLGGLRLTLAELFEKGLLLDWVLFLAVVVRDFFLHLYYLSEGSNRCARATVQYRDLSCSKHRLFGMALPQLIPWRHSGHASEIIVISVHHHLTVGYCTFICTDHSFIVILRVISIFFIVL